MAKAKDEESAASAWTTLAAAIRGKAEAWLEVQTRLAALGIDNLKEQNAFELSHLKWRRFNDRMKGTLQVMTALVGAALAAAIGLAVWNASQAEGLVVDAFSVPPSFVQDGIGGDVVANDFTGKIAAIRGFANANSLHSSRNVRQERDQEIKVEIPQTGVSVSEAWRYLRLWLGHERHLSGDLRNLEGGRIALTVTLDGEIFTAQGARRDLDRLEQQIAENVFTETDPTNIVLYLLGHGRGADAMPAAARAVDVVADGPPAERAESYALWAVTARLVQGDSALGMRRARIGMAIDPTQATPHREVMVDARDLGHDEEALAQASLLDGIRRSDQSVTFRAGGFPWVEEAAKYVRADSLGDFAWIVSDPCAIVCSPVALRLRRAEYFAQLHDAAGAEASIHEAAATGATAMDAGRARYFTDVATGNWDRAIVDSGSYGMDVMTRTRVRWVPQMVAKLLARLSVTQARPMLAIALAHRGDFAAAHRAIDTTPGDCYLCLRMRGNIDALEEDWGGAAWWFARAVAAAPSLPFAYSDWGQMLLARGDAAGAIAKFTLANQRGPHFANALEAWGEALMIENRSDLALEKFAEAAKCAPNWRRLHLKWGEALLYAGGWTQARQQFAAAAALRGTAADGAELGYFRAKAGP